MMWFLFFDLVKLKINGEIYTIFFAKLPYIVIACIVAAASTTSCRYIFEQKHLLNVFMCLKAERPNVCSSTRSHKCQAFWKGSVAYVWGLFIHSSIRRAFLSLSMITITCIYLEVDGNHVKWTYIIKCKKALIDMFGWVWIVCLD